MSEGLAKKILGPGATIESAGSHPSTVNPLAVEALKEIGIESDRQWSKSVDQLEPGFIVQLDYVITLCAEEVCPTMVSKAKKLHWPLPDPAGAGGSHQERLEKFRVTRDLIKKRLVEFAREVD